VAIQDDLTIVGPPNAIIRALTAVEEACEKEGLKLTLSKCAVLCRSTSSVAPEILSLVRDKGIRIGYGAMKVLGSVVGTDDAAIQNILAETEAKHDRFFNAVRHMPSQYSLLFLRMCGVPRLNYLARTVTPTLMQDVVALFDGRVADCFRCLAGRPNRPLPPYAELMVAIPMRMGGVGLRRYSQVCYAAWFSALAAAAKYMDFGSKMAMVRAILDPEIRSVSDSDGNFDSEVMTGLRSRVAQIKPFSETRFFVLHALNGCA